MAFLPAADCRMDGPSVADQRSARRAKRRHIHRPLTHERPPWKRPGKRRTVRHPALHQYRGDMNPSHASSPAEPASGYSAAKRRSPRPDAASSANAWSASRSVSTWSATRDIPKNTPARSSTTRRSSSERPIPRTSSSTPAAPADSARRSARTISTWATFASRRAGPWCEKGSCPHPSTSSPSGTWPTATASVSPSAVTSRGKKRAPGSISPAASSAPPLPGEVLASYRLSPGKACRRCRDHAPLLRRPGILGRAGRPLPEVPEAIRREWERLGRPLVITACSTCRDLFQEHLPEMETRTIWKSIEETGLPFRGRSPASCGEGKTVTVADPCITRHDRETQGSVRRIARSLGFTIEELPLSGGKPECCGYGGLMYNADPDLARDVMAHRTTGEHRSCPPFPCSGQG